ncbi:MAG: class I tRNA ligase family protein, partial [Clostridia bacterium]|nr:class I tRNA ligase family protein [Clostridia bacterium]
MKYDHKSIESKWQKKWEDAGIFHAEENSSKEKFYALIEFPYPSGQGLHVGHPRSYTALDIVSRKRRMQGYNVLYPIGWDAFGLPTENYAIKNHVHPKTVTAKNVARFKSQLQALGISFDWSREINTTDPKYYKWTQWIFLQLFKNGLAYKKEMAVNWCTSCKCVLANEEVVNGVCERCGSEVVRKVKSQWMLKITEYADRLIKDLDLVDYPDRVKAQQKNWIGRSTGAEVRFGSTAGDDLTVYTTRPDTLFGATYMVIAPEHPY